MSGEDSRIAMLSIIVEDPDKTGRLNDLLHKYNRYIIGRMGIPYRAKNLFLIAIAVDAPETVTSALTGQIGRIDGISVKCAYAKK